MITIKYAKSGRKDATVTLRDQINNRTLFLKFCADGSIIFDVLYPVTEYSPNKIAHSYIKTVHREFSELVNYDD